MAPSQPTYLPFEDTADEHSQKQLAAARHSAFLLLLTSVDDGVGLVFLVEELGLTEELDELVGTSVERQRLLELARARLDELVPRLV